MDLEEHYRATIYWVQTPDAWFPLRVGQRHPDLDVVLGGSWAFVTSDNPGSLPLPPAENEARRAALDAELAGWQSYWGIGIGQGTDWPPEISRVVVGIDREEALALGRRHGQRAIVYGEVGGCAELLDCRGG